jgi:2-hydroxychromene-2-carboxylate isomerase
VAERTFAVTWDYRCPFAHHAHGHVVTALAAGAPWAVTFVPFSLDQVHVADGGRPVWDDPAKRQALLAMLAGIAVRDRFPDCFPAVHTALFAARHRESLDLRDEAVVRRVLEAQGVDADAVVAEIDDGEPLAAFRREHERMVEQHSAFGVPTFVADGRAVFVRLMQGPQDDADLARQTVERVLDLLTGWDDLNEFKLTTLAR